MIDALQTGGTRVGLEINISKTKDMTNSFIKQIKINGNPLEYTEKYI